MNMYQKALRTFGVFLVFLFCAVGSAQALPLTGQTLLGTNSGGTLSPSTTAVVGSGVEFTADWFGTPFFDIDFTEGGLVTVTHILIGGLTHNASQILSFSDFFGTIPSFNSFDLISISGFTGITQADFSFTADSISIQMGLGGTLSNPGDFFTAQISVPEPATLALLGAGLAGLGFSRRKKRA